MFEFVLENAKGVRISVYPILIVSIVLTVGLYLLRSFAIYKIAKNDKSGKVDSIAFLSFIPFVWIILATKLCGTIDAFGKRLKNFGLVISTFFIVSSVLVFVINLLDYIPFVSYMLKGNTVIYLAQEGEIENFAEIVGYSYGFRRFLNVTSYISESLSLISDVLMIFFYAAFFRKYWLRHSVMGTIFSLFGLFPIFAFVVRNNEPFDYEKFLKERYQRMNNPYGNGYNGQNFNGYNSQSNPFGDFENRNGGDRADTPFNETGNNGSADNDPFPEFKDKK